MEYYNILNFKKEPFSNSPAPEFLFQSSQYTGCLQKLELAIRLRRGLNVVIGAVGTGKTTLCRKLIQDLDADQQDASAIETYLLLDPSFNSSLEFLHHVALLLNVQDLDRCTDEWQLKEKIKDYLFNKGVKEEKIIVLVIDEGQKIAENCLEILRELLNYETNSFKLLQIVIFAQEEFKSLLKKRANLLDRVNMLYYLKPLGFDAMRQMITYRINVARNFEIGPPLFSIWGLLAVYFTTGGYPRKVVALCHQVILGLIIRGRSKAGFFFVKSRGKEIAAPLRRSFAGSAVAAAIIIISAVLIYIYGWTLQKTNTVKEPVRADKIIGEQLSGSDQLISESREPELLGEISVKKGWTLWWLLQNVYGENSPAITEAIKKANPHLKNIDKLEAGEIINFPAIPSKIRPLENGFSIIQITSGEKLADVYNIFRGNQYQKKIPETIFFSSWNKKKGMTFSVVINKCFSDNAAAENEIKRMPVSIAAKTKILSSWDNDTLFYNRHLFRCPSAGSSGG